MLSIVLGLGANQGDPAAVFAGALTALAAETEVVGRSRLWLTRAVGPAQPDYTNAAVLVRWPGGPEHLLARCHELEARAGRLRPGDQRWGPRPLDLDLLIARDLVWRSPRLELPHPRLAERAFALVPAAEVAPDWLHPLLGRTLDDLAAAARATTPDAILSSTPFNV
ncbi:MAG: 2-amino-4-hydroxy-6-hydroxymethyldihydropteridine diphosphokinase [Holophagae bacterium]|jgi:2-amino-4-hydroxy-6-hydroxymethyldihydropteridine diphosphokinase